MPGYNQYNQPTAKQFSDMRQFMEKQHPMVADALFPTGNDEPSKDIQQQILDELKGIRFELTMQRWRDQSNDFERFWDSMKR